MSPPACCTGSTACRPARPRRAGDHQFGRLRGCDLAAGKYYLLAADRRIQKQSGRPLVDCAQSRLTTFTGKVIGILMSCTCVVVEPLDVIAVIVSMPETTKSLSGAGPVVHCSFERSSVRERCQARSRRIFQSFVKRHRSAVKDHSQHPNRFRISRSAKGDVFARFIEGKMPCDFLRVAAYETETNDMAKKGYYQCEGCHLNRIY